MLYIPTHIIRLDFWTPNINPFKDPRWGRGQETPGEDTFHLQSYVAQLISGLQEDDKSQYRKVVSTCKHYAAYDLEGSGSTSRHEFNAVVTTQDLVEYYLPSFRTCAKDAKVGAFMCSYNAVNGIPSCANDYLLQTILRGHWGWNDTDKWVTSDCDAVSDVYSPHNYTSTAAQAVADSLKAGTDLDCGTFYLSNLGAALNQGLIEDADLDRALTRLYGSLIKLGYFDDPAQQPYRSLTWSDVNTGSSQQLAYKAAASGIVLLQNDGILPVTSTDKKIALIGPWANASTQMQGNYAGVAPYLHGPLYAAQQSGLDVTYALGTAINSTDTSGFGEAISAANASDIIIYAGGIDNTIEAEGQDRLSIVWPGNQLDLISQLAGLGKPIVVLQMGGGQVDDSSLLMGGSSAVNALIWGGYPGQDGGTALIDIITGKVAPAGRLPITQYPADYINQVPITNMALRSGTDNPGRTYKWYSGSPVIEFGTGLHYTDFGFSWTAGTQSATLNIQDLLGNSQKQESDWDSIEKQIFQTFKVSVSNEGKVASDYVALLFLKTDAGPTPAPFKTLVSYARVHDIGAGSSGTAILPVTLGSLARIDEDGNTNIYPGNYSVVLDVPGQITFNFTLTGDTATLEDWPADTTA